MKWQIFFLGIGGYYGPALIATSSMTDEVHSDEIIAAVTHFLGGRRLVTLLLLTYDLNTRVFNA